MTNRKLTILLALTLLTAFAAQVRAVDAPEVEAEAAANANIAAQYVNQPERKATVSIKASTKPSVEGEPPPIPDVDVTLPMPLPLPALPQPKFKEDGHGPLFDNIYQLIVFTLVSAVILAAAFPRLREFFNSVFRKKKVDPPPPTP